MAQVGSGTSGKVLVAKGSGASPKFEDIGTDSGLTSNGLVVSKGTSAFVATSALTDGQVVIGRSGNTPVAANLTAGAGVSITNGSGSITIGLSGGGQAFDTVTNNSGTNPVVPDVNGNLNLLGSGSITTVASSNTSTFQLTGLTQYNVLAGEGTATIQKIAPSATSGVPLISQGSSAYPVFGTTVVAGGGTGAASFNTNGVVISNTTSTGSLAALSLSSGQIVIGGSGAPAASTLTGGTGISISNGNNSITINGIGGGFTWTSTSGSFTASVNNGYFLSAASTPTLPSSPSNGDCISFICDTTSTVTLTANTGQTIRFGSSVSSTAGTAASTARGDSLTLVYRSAATSWIANAGIGNWTIS